MITWKNYQVFKIWTRHAVLLIYFRPKCLSLLHKSLHIVLVLCTLLKNCWHWKNNKINTWLSITITHISQKHTFQTRRKIFTKQLLVSSPLSALPSDHTEKLRSVRTDFHGILRWTFLKEPDDQVQVLLKPRENNRYFASIRTYIHNDISPFKE